MGCSNAPPRLLHAIRASSPRNGWLRLQPMSSDSPTAPLQHLTTAGNEYRTRLAGVGPDAWTLDTPCEGWSIRDLTAHVVTGNLRVTYLLEGSSVEQAAALVDRDLLEDDPLGAFDRSFRAQIQGFSAVGALERICPHPIGDMPGRALLRFRTIDLTLHAWDLARATGSSEVLDPALVAHAWREIEPTVSRMGAMGIFGDGPSGTLPEGAPLQLRLLDASGRRP